MSRESAQTPKDPAAAQAKSIKMPGPGKDLIHPRSRAYYFILLRPSTYSADGVSGVPVIIRVTSMPIWTHL